MRARIFTTMAIVCLATSSLAFADEGQQSFLLGGGLGAAYPQAPATFKQSARYNYHVSGWGRYSLSNGLGVQLGYDHLQYVAKPAVGIYPQADIYTLSLVKSFS